MTRARRIAPELLISPEFQSFSVDQVIRDGVLDVYLHRPAGPVVVRAGNLGTQTIQALSLDDAFASFLTTAIKRLDSQLTLDFRIVTAPEAADVRLYLDSEVNVGGPGITLGIAIPNDTTEEDFWELILNVPAFKGDLNYLRYIALHELGHALGLEHPFDATDGEVFVSKKSSKGAYPEDTVMAYRSPRGEAWPAWYSANDLAALRTIWGDSGTDPVIEGGTSRSSRSRLPSPGNAVSAAGLPLDQPLQALPSGRDLCLFPAWDFCGGLLASTTGDLG